MPGTQLGGFKARDKNLAKDSNFYRRIGATGGAKRNPLKGFGANRELASIAGTKGGRISKRTKKAK